ncbi:MAG: TonB-dependent receptor, partial [Chitinophagia bacterium]|nr:TonB-dependent receptor [Chitinophagia bacterium]
MNLLPERPAATTKGITGSAIAEGHSNNGLLGVSAGLLARQGDWSYTLRTTIRTAHDYRNSIDGYVYNTGFREAHLGGTATLGKRWGASHLGATLYHNLQEIPDGSRDSLTRAFTWQQYESGNDDIKNRPVVSYAQLLSYSIAPLHQYIRHYRLYNQTTVALPGGDLAILLAWQQNIRREFTHPTVTVQPGMSVYLHTVNYAASYRRTINQQWSAVAGANGMYQQNSSRNATDIPIPDYHLFDLGAYATLQYEKGGWLLMGGLRSDTRHLGWDNLYTGTDATTGFQRRVYFPDTVGASLQYPAFNTTYRGFSGSIGATYTLSSHWLFKANVARGYRAPNITEVGANGLDPGAHIVYLGNRKFRPEFSLQQDAGVVFTIPGCTLMADIFHNRITGYIYQARAFDASGNPLVVVPGNATYQYQQGDARLVGGELSVKIVPQR